MYVCVRKCQRHPEVFQLSFLVKVLINDIITYLNLLEELQTKSVRTNSDMFTLPIIYH